MVNRFRRSPEVEHVTDTAAVRQKYLEFLDGYLKRGGKVTFSASRFAGAEMQYQRGGEVLVDSDTEYGAKSRTLIAGEGTRVGRTDPATEERSPWAHTRVYSLDGFESQGGVPAIYTDREFDPLVSKYGLEMQQRDEMWEYVSNGLSDVIPERFGGTQPDDHVPGMPSDAGQAQTTPPTGLDPSTAQAFSAAFGTRDNPAVQPASGAVERKPGTQDGPGRPSQPGDRSSELGR